MDATSQTQARRTEVGRPELEQITAACPVFPKGARIRGEGKSRARGCGRRYLDVAVCATTHRPTPAGRYLPHPATFLPYMSRVVVCALLMALVSGCGQPTVNLPPGAKSVAFSDLNGGPIWKSGDAMIASLSYSEVLRKAMTLNPRCNRDPQAPDCLPPYPGSGIPTNAPPDSLYLALPPVAYCYEHQERAGLKNHQLTFVYWIGPYTCRTGEAQPESTFLLVAVPLHQLPSGTLAVRVTYQVQGSDYRSSEQPATQVAIP